MRGEQSPPPMGKPGQLAARDRHYRTIVSAVRQLVEHVEPLPYSLPEDLAQNLVHLYNSTFPCSVCAPAVCAPAVCAPEGQIATAASRELQS